MSPPGPDRHLGDGSERVPPDPPPPFDDFEVLADMVATPADGYLRECRECHMPFVTRVRSHGTKWTDCCTSCLRFLG